MPRGKTTSGSKNGLPPFIRCVLSDGDLKNIQEHIYEDAGVIGLLVYVAENDLRISCSWDAYNDCYSVTITSKPDANGKNSAALSSRGPDVYSAFTVAGYKLHEKLGGDFKEADTSTIKQSWG